MKNEITELTNSSKLKYIFKSVLFAYILLFVLVLFYSFGLAYTDLPESTMTIAVTLITIIAVLTSSIIYCKKMVIKGLVNGSIIGCVFTVTLYLLGGIFATGFELDTQSIIVIITNILFGGIGGTVGVNLNRLQR